MRAIVFSVGGKWPQEHPALSRLLAIGCGPAKKYLT